MYTIYHLRAFGYSIKICREIAGDLDIFLNLHIEINESHHDGKQDIKHTFIAFHQATPDTQKQ